VYLFVNFFENTIIIIFRRGRRCQLDSVVRYVYSVKAMSHCPYLLHKFVINYFFDYSVCFIQVTDCSIGVSWFFAGAPLFPTWVATLMILIMIEMQYSGTTLLLLVNHAYCIETIIPHVPLIYLPSEKKTLRCQLPLCSSTNQQLF